MKLFYKLCYAMLCQKYARGVFFTWRGVQVAKPLGRLPNSFAHAALSVEGAPPAHGLAHAAVQSEALFGALPLCEAGQHLLLSDAPHGLISALDFRLVSAAVLSSCRGLPRAEVSLLRRAAGTLAHLCVCVCVWRGRKKERESERDRERDRERGREGGREGGRS